MSRKAPLKPRSGKAKRRDWQSAAYREWIRERSLCDTCGAKEGQPYRMHASHVDEVGRAGTDKDNLITQCAACHDLLHTGGWSAVRKARGVTRRDMRELAAELTERWLIERSRETLDVPAEWQPDRHMLDIGATLEFLRSEGYDGRAARVKYDSAGQVRSIAGLPLRRWEEGQRLEDSTKRAAQLLRHLGLKGHRSAEAQVGMSDEKYGQVGFWRQAS